MKESQEGSRMAYSLPAPDRTEEDLRLRPGDDASDPERQRDLSLEEQPWLPAGEPIGERDRTLRRLSWLLREPREAPRRLDTSGRTGLGFGLLGAREEGLRRGLGLLDPYCIYLKRVFVLIK